MTDDSHPVAPDAILEPGRSAENAGPVETSLEMHGAAESQVARAPDPRGASNTGGGVSDSPAISPRKQRDLTFIEKQDSRIRKRATGILQAALRAPDLAEVDLEAHRAAGTVPPGWTKKQLRVALDANNSMKAAPAYLSIAQRVFDSYKKAESEKSEGPVLNAEVVQIQVNQYSYPKRVLDEE